MGKMPQDLHKKFSPYQLIQVSIAVVYAKPDHFAGAYNSEAEIGACVSCAISSRKITGSFVI